MQTGPSAKIDEIVRQYGRELLATAPPPPSYAGPEIDRNIADTQFHIQEQLAALRYAVKNNDFADKEIDTADPLPEVRARATELAQLQEIDLSQWDAGYVSTLHQGVARAMIEKNRQFLHRMTDPFATYAPADYLFADTLAVVPGVGKPLPPSPTFREAASLYVKAKAGVVWTPRTEQENRRLLIIASQHFGAETPIAAISKDDVRKLRDAILTWKRKPKAGATLLDMVGAPEGKRISAVTANKYFGYLLAAFSYWAEEGHIEKSPAGKLSVKVGKASKVGAREPFSDDDLKGLFSSPMFTLCAGPLRRTIPGPERVRDGFYWVPLVAALSGMRVTEIVQLQMSDVQIAGDVPAVRVRGDADGGKSVKTAAGWRLVPLHRRLIALGFLEFVSSRRTTTGNPRLFRDVPFAKTGGGGGEFSKWFGRRMTALGLKRPGLVFHSFRHRFIDEMRESGAPSYVIKAIVGHEGGDTTDKYGSKPSAALCKQWMDKLSFLDCLPPAP